MPQTRDNGTVIPINADAWNLTTDLQTMADSIRAVTVCVNQAARDALIVYTGRVCYRTDLQAFEVWNGSSWGLHSSLVQEASITSFSTGYTGLTGAHLPRVRRMGNQCFVYGAVNSSSTSGLNICTLPAAFHPPNTGTRFMGCIITSLNTTSELLMTAGTIAIASSGYGTLWDTKTTAQVIPICLHYYMD